MLLHANHHEPTTAYDISSREFWSKTPEERDETFRRLRAEAPVSWHLPIESNLPPEVHGQAGFWAVTKAEDITYISQHHDLFSSALASTALHPYQPHNDQLSIILDMDPPVHTAYRKVISSAFTPKAVAKLSAQIEARAQHIVDRVVGAGGIDFVTEVSAKLPMMTVADLMGIPEHQVEAFAAAGNQVALLQDSLAQNPEANFTDLFAEVIGALSEIGFALAEERRKNPKDDIMSAIVHADVDGVTFDQDAILSTMILLSVAGNDTTKQTTTHTVIQLARNPDQAAWLREDFDGRIAGAVEEFVRHASPVISFARTATQDLDLGGRRILAGDKVGMLYASGNRDESVFDNPHRFDLSRKRSPHVGFGGGGVHYCLGNSVAKAQLRALFRQILTKLPVMEVGEPERLTSDFINGYRHLPVVIG
ncbi:cytochrome P450 [Amycolatopsis pithecellobii]|uniref:Cytochrome P450 n=1 Tax=Amycolatopsis pithecellobii TaxID=664692 RepID=A0A6N7YUK6_9PSEU|nr:cytochrome P450 [Amycolatopsis pithecellobii]MTD55608.1 cytochrome P450 [Amycolatopsis pithecellobii]